MRTHATLLVSLFLVIATGCGTVQQPNHGTTLSPPDPVDISQLPLRVRFLNIPLRYVLEEYADKSGKTVEAVKGVDAKVTMTPEGELTVQQYLALIEEKLAEQNIALFEISKDRLVATWKDPAKAPARTSSGPLTTPRVMSYRERLEARREAMRQRQAAPPVPKLTGEDLEKRLREYNLEAIRKGQPALPIRLTPEEDAQLVEEGILPPLETKPVEKESPPPFLPKE